GPHGRQLRAERPRPGRDEDDAHAGEQEALARGLGGAADGDASGADTWPGGPSPRLRRPAVGLGLPQAVVRRTGRKRDVHAARGRSLARDGELLRHAQREPEPLEDGPNRRAVTPLATP